MVFSFFAGVGSQRYLLTPLFFFGFHCRLSSVCAIDFYLLCAIDGDNLLNILIPLAFAYCTESSCLLSPHWLPLRGLLWSLFFIDPITSCLPASQCRYCSADIHNCNIGTP